MGNMGEEEIMSPAGSQPTPDSSPSSSSDPRDLQSVESPAYRLVSPTRADFIDGTPPVQIKQSPYSNRQAKLEGERESILEKCQSSPNTVDRWLKLLRDRDKLLRLSFCKENASILEGQIQRLEGLCKSVERLSLCPDPLVEQFCMAVGDVIKLCPLVLDHLKNPSLHDHMERGQSPLQPSAPSPQHSWVENERRMSNEFTKGKMSPSTEDKMFRSNDGSMGSPTCTPPKYSSTQNVGEAIDAFQVGTSIWSPLTPDESNNTNHIQSRENSLIGSYFALPEPSTSPQESSTPGSMLSVSNQLKRRVTLSTQTSPMLKSTESSDNNPDSSMNKTNNTSSAFTDSDDPVMARKDMYTYRTKNMFKPSSFNLIDKAIVNSHTLQTSPLLEFSNTKDMNIFKNNNYVVPELNITDIKKDKKWRKVKSRRNKKGKKGIVHDDLSSGDDTPKRDMSSPPKRARMNSEYDDEKVTKALIASLQNLGQPSRYVLLEHLEPTLV